MLRSIALAAAVAAAVVAVPPAPATPTLPIGNAAGVMQAAGYGEMASGRQFLAFDPRGDGRAVEVLGDLATASRVVIVVPGSDTTLADFDRGLGGVSRRAPAVQARVVYEAIHSPRVVVIAWLGYDPPEGFGLAAMRQDRAIAGAADLKRFVGLLPPQATVIVIGHSYGSVVVSLAAPGFGQNVTDIVALASPGMGAARVADLHTTARVWTAAAPGDWIGRVPKLRFAGLGHGGVPADARHLPVDGVDGHDGYLVPGSATLEALARMAVDHTVPAAGQAEIKKRSR